MTPPERHAWASERPLFAISMRQLRRPSARQFRAQQTPLKIDATNRSCMTFVSKLDSLLPSALCAGTVAGASIVRTALSPLKNYRPLPTAIGSILVNPVRWCRWMAWYSTGHSFRRSGRMTGESLTVEKDAGRNGIRRSHQPVHSAAFCSWLSVIQARYC